MTAQTNRADDCGNELTVLVLGLRGFPEVPGGVETHAENLYPLIARSGIRVICITRRPYHRRKTWAGIEFRPTWSPRSKYLEAILHSLVAVIKAAFIRPDVVHVHAVGPSLVVPLARLLGLRVVVTHHGPDYDREKWNALAARMLRLGEWCGMKFASRRIVISPVIADMVRQRYGVDCTIIPNGVALPELDTHPSEVGEFGLQAGRYVLLVSRFVPEKRHVDLIRAFERIHGTDLQLALVGDADHPDAYARSLKDRAAKNRDIVMTGFLGGRELRAVFQHALVFVLPSSHEGLPISLLEALSFGLPCIASDIAANQSVGLAADAYFELGDIDQLAGKIEEVSARPWSEADRSRTRRWVAERYDWTRIAEQTASVYREALD